MNVKELRIGNCIETPCGFWPICEITNQYVCVKTLNDCIYKFDIKDCAFSLLTDKYLENLGFIKNEFLFEKKYGNQGLLMIFSPSSPLAKQNNIKKYYYFFNNLVHQLEYFHELQNLYLDLSKEELPLN